MDIMVARVIGSNVLQWIEWQCVTAMVVNSLDSGTSEEPHGLSAGHTADEISEPSSQCIQQEAFEWMIVQGSISVWHI
jgi:hypothetical protein